MSRTDVHRPWRVQLTDPLVRRRCRIGHDHWRLTAWNPVTRRWDRRESVPCDLWESAGKGRCTWWPNRNFACGCPLCTGKLGRRHSHRRDRTAWRSSARELLKTGRGDVADVDVAPPGPVRW